MQKIFAIIWLVGALSSLSLAKGSPLNDLEVMTFTCPSAALNAAARVAAMVPSSGSYQFVSFNTIRNGGGKQFYLVSFESNYYGESRLNYEVSLYCQQGFDPNKSVKVVLKK